VANQALAQAEQSFQESPDSYQTRDLAYVAQRKSEIAEATASIAIERLEVSQTMGLKVRASCLAGIRPAEEPILLWAQRLQREGFDVQVRFIVPDSKVAGLWRFELKGEVRGG
jgi:hypothetical protein